MKTWMIILALAVPSAGWACGGLFCANGSNPMVPPAPVDQSAERILFEVAEGDICATVEILYAGDPTEFAWVVPVPEAPTVGEAASDYFDRLDLATQLAFQLPAPTFDNCAVRSRFDDGDGDGGCGCAEDGGGAGLPSAEVGDAGAEPPREVPPVQVLDRQRTENYETATIAAADAADLVGWLQDNDFNVSDNMVPAMTPYTAAGMPFLAIKLRTDRGASAITPLRFCYRADQPMVPLQLTAVAAQPQMGVLVFIAADRAYAPTVGELAVAPVGALAFDTSPQVNYFAWVAREAALAAGRFFNLEYSGRHVVDDGPAVDLDCGEDADSPECRLEANRASLVHLTRMYTRLGPELMTFDPEFAPEPIADYAGSVDLSGRQPLFNCGQLVGERLPSPCAFNYCGPDARCGVVQGQAACECPEAQVAVPMTDPTGVERAVCAPRINPLGVTAEDGGDPCRAYDCGLGACVARGGFPTCRCDAGAAAIANGNRVICAEAGDAVAWFGEGAGPEAGNPIFDVPAAKNGRFGIGLLAFGGVLLIGVIRRWR